MSQDSYGPPAGSVGQRFTICFPMRTMARLLVLLLVSSPLFAQSENVWQQWGGGPAHHGTLGVYGQSLRTTMADIIYDPFVPQERAEVGGALLVHYQTPLSGG